MSVTDDIAYLSGLLTENSLFNDITFVPAYTKDNVSRPVKAPFCSIGVHSAEERSGLYSYITYELRVYVPLSTGGNGCIECMARMSEYLLNAMPGAFETEIGGVQYDSHMMGFTSGLFLKCNRSRISAPSSGESTEVVINSSSIAAEICNVTEKTNYHNVYSLWQGEPVESIKCGKSYEIEIGGFDADVARTADALDSFTLMFDGVSYLGCRFTSIIFDMNGDLVSRALISAKERTVSYG